MIKNKKYCIIRKNEKKNNELSEKDRLYAQIATLERSTKFLIEKKQQELVMKEKDETSLQQISQETYKEVYEKVKEISQDILGKNNKSEITLWYLAKIERTECNLQKEESEQDKERGEI